MSPKVTAWDDDNVEVPALIDVCEAALSPKQPGVDLILRVRRFPLKCFWTITMVCTVWAFVDPLLVGSL
ncbi:hypothetical protein KTH_50300 [Thermosporothrix hazakensis]|nr:hypothetical protein KTH_50300 [Thermosporothrix hazakensis]